jgi:hypothetical protein
LKEDFVILFILKLFENICKFQKISSKKNIPSLKEFFFTYQWSADQFFGDESQNLAFWTTWGLKGKFTVILFCLRESFHSPRIRE